MKVEQDWAQPDDDVITVNPDGSVTVTSPLSGSAPSSLLSVDPELDDFLEMISPGNPLVTDPRALSIKVVTAVPLPVGFGAQIIAARPGTATIQRIWMLRYNSGSASANKWEFLGGAALDNEVATEEATASVAYVDLATVGPSITIPLAGDYLVTGGAYIWTEDLGALQAFASLKIGAAATADPNRQAWMAVSADATGARRGGQFASKGEVLTLAAADVLKLQYRVTAGAATFGKRWISVLPIRLL